AADAFPDGLDPPLPPGDPGIGRTAMFEEERGAAGFEHAADFGQHRRLLGDRADGEGGDDGVELTVAERHRLAHAAADIGGDSVRLRRSAAHFEQLGRGVEPGEAPDAVAVIKFHVDPAAAAELEYVARRVRHDLAARLHDLPLRTGAFDQPRY